jgi:hypothetical protein
MKIQGKTIEFDSDGWKVTELSDGRLKVEHNTSGETYHFSDAGELQASSLTAGSLNVNEAITASQSFPGAVQGTWEVIESGTGEFGVSGLDTKWDAIIVNAPMVSFDGSSDSPSIRINGDSSTNYNQGGSTGASAWNLTSQAGQGFFYGYFPANIESPEYHPWICNKNRNVDAPPNSYEHTDPSLLGSDLTSIDITSAYLINSGTKYVIFGVGY